MPVIYATPIAIIDAHEWRAVVQQHGPRSRPVKVFQWRPLTARVQRWKPADEWTGPRPKDMWKRFWRYRLHIAEAMEHRERRADALATLAKRPPTRAALDNCGDWERALRQHEAA